MKRLESCKTYYNKLIRRIKSDAYQAGFEGLHLCTDHIGYYEHYALHISERAAILGVKAPASIAHQPKSDFFENVKKTIDKSCRPRYNNHALFEMPV